mmetsp:Transcript_28793/g.40108  ORF Transcript_28793/g.40108 Transcript_28793/m.40108 type:complete len:265 (+) Transcript_28793:611-1405(+)
MPDPELDALTPPCLIRGGGERRRVFNFFCGRCRCDCDGESERTRFLVDIAGRGNCRCPFDDNAAEDGALVFLSLWTLIASLEPPEFDNFLAVLLCLRAWFSRRKRSFSLFMRSISELRTLAPMLKTDSLAMLFAPPVGIGNECLPTGCNSRVPLASTTVQPFFLLRRMCCIQGPRRAISVMISPFFNRVSTILSSFGSLRTAAPIICRPPSTFQRNFLSAVDLVPDLVSSTANFAGTLTKSFNAACFFLATSYIRLSRPIGTGL